MLVTKMTNNYDAENRGHAPGPGWPMGRTTLRIDDELLRRLRRRAADEDRTLQDVTNEALRRGLEDRPMASEYRLELQGWEARLRPGVDLTDRRSLLDVMEDRT